MRGEKYRFCVVTYEAFPNPITQNLKTYLLANYKCDLLYIFHPMAEVKGGLISSSGYNLFRKNELAESKKAFEWKAPVFILYLKDVFYTFLWCLKFGKIDVYFACGNLNPIAGLILRSVGIVEKVVYQSLDYYSVRYKNRFLNWMYFKLDKFCVRFSDETWNVSSEITRARYKKMGMDPKLFNRQITVPGCIWFHKVKRLPFSKVNKTKIVYRGTLLAHMGVDLTIRAMPYMLKKIPSLRFEIVGTGEEEKRLKKLAHDLKVSKNIVFHGFVEGRENMERVLSDAALGVATFNIDRSNDKVRNSDPGKIKDYMLMGMPVITTEICPYSEQITKNKSGLVVSYSAEDLAEKTIKLIRNENLLREYRKNAVKFVERFDCANILKLNVERVLSRRGI